MGTLANLVLLILLINHRIALQLDPVSIILLVLWATAFQYGTYWHLKYQLVPWWFKLKEHLLVFLASPILGLLDTLPAIRALWDWYISRKRSVVWQPTVKNLKKRVLPNSCNLLEFKITKFSEKSIKIYAINDNLRWLFKKRFSNN